MRDQQFDAVVGALGDPATPRRRVLAALAAGALAIVRDGAGSEAAAGRRERRRRRRNRRGGVRVCFKGVELVVDRVAARELVSRGGRLGRCRAPEEVPEETLACQGATLHCAANPTSCGGASSMCICTLTIGGASVCAENQVVCDADESTCTEDQDCVARFGAGFSCVSTQGCSGLACGGNGNACAPPCQG